MNHLNTIIELTFLYTPLAMGIVIVFRISKFPDLTIDGSFALGGAVSAKLIIMGLTFWSIPISLLAGAIAGFVTASLHVFFKINKILSGILVAFALYSVNLRIMNSSNIQLVNYPTSISFFEKSQNYSFILFLMALTLLAFFIILYFLRTEVGLFFRANGQNPYLVKDIGKSTKLYTCLGPIIGNSFVAVTGSIVAQRQGFADVNMGFGMLITGLAFLFIGAAVIRKNNLSGLLFSSFIGVLIYEIIYTFSLSIGLRASDLKMAAAGLVITCLWLTRSKKIKVQMEEIF